MVSIAHKHHVAGLEIAVHERLAGHREQVTRQLLEVVFQFILIEGDARSLKETVLEVVQVPLDGTLVKALGGIAVVIVKAFGTTELEIHQVANGTA